jgi:hypothetical protein
LSLLISGRLIMLKILPENKLTELFYTVEAGVNVDSFMCNLTDL